MIRLLTPSERTALRRILPLLRIDRRMLALSILIGSCGLGSAIALSATSAWLIARASEQPPVLYLTVAATAVRLFGVSRAVLRYCQRLASHSVALNGMDALRQNLYAHMSRRRTDRLTMLRRGDLLARTGADVDDVGDLVVKTILPAAVCAVVGIGTVIGMTLLSPATGLVLALCLLLSGVVAPVLSMRGARLAEAASRRARTELAASTMTIMDGATELQVSGVEPVVRRTLARTEDALTAATSRASRVLAIAAGVDRLAMGLAVVAALVIGVPATASGSLAPVLLAVIVLTPLASFEGTAELGPAAAQLVRSAAAAERIAALLGEDEPTAEHDLPAGAAPAVEARGLSIGWPGGPVVAEGIDLDLRPGRRIALVGPSGIGKTTLAMTLAGMLEPRAGRSLICGVDAWGASRAHASSVVTVTAEDAHVFATTVYENLRVARVDLTRDDAAALLARAGLGPWLADLPDGLDTLIGSGGTTVSGGERRRLLMARALAAPAPLMIVDEAGEHLDAATADALMDALLAADPARGILVITHRLSALEAADEVVVLDRQGPGPATIVARGPHSRIVESRASYRWAVEQENR
ncbi:thiol reductant ABC exporter subunit CydC [Actinomyces sp. B33]|uniref:thiol reductant ABC exporter subunit CydC n=1 Tax=Actinomyces sp. B33 TaxID=2942131 RepID=UPI00233F95F0|nr:thiol reductant ABC exporter subunit CydC [Actinomyces sp. B33]MDC4233119.1 thiol reductant ABC exporter subunit CydC [Actinomyces sp. B33]